MKNWKIAAVSTLAITSMGLSAMTVAGHDHGRDGARHGFMKSGHEGKSLNRMAKKLDLSDEQKSQIEALFEGTEDERSAHHDAMQEARKNISEAISSGASQSDVQLMADKIGQLVADKTMAKYQMRQKMSAILTQEQLEKMDELRNKRKARGKRHD